MAINKRKVLEAARKYAQKGAQAKALKEFEKLLKLDPRDARLRLEVGDAHRRWGNNAEAIDTYKKVAEQYMKEGFDARAVAVYKQIHNLSPEAYDSYEPLADLYQRMGLISEAILALQTAADGYHKEGKKKEALDLLRKMATLDPSNTTSRIKVADLLRQEELFTEAVNEYVEASAELERQGDRDGAVSVYERILEIDSNRMETLLLLAENLVDRGFGDRAEPSAKRILELKPDEPAHYELMATVYRLQKREDELVETYRKLADLHRRRGDEDQAREILQRYVPSGGIEEAGGIDEETAFGGMNGAADLGDSGTFGDSFAAESDEPLGDLADSTGFNGLGLDGDVPTLLDEEVLAPGEGDSDGDLLSFDDSVADDVALDLEDALEPEVDAGLGAEAGTETGNDVTTVASGHAVVEEHAQPDPEADPDQLLAEASVYLRYGKRDQAIANLEAIIEQDSEHRAALEKLGEAYTEGGDGPKAVGVWLRAAELARSAGDVEAVAVLRDRVAAIEETAVVELDAAIASDSEDGDASEQPAASAEGEATVIDLDAIDSPTDVGAHEIDLDDIEIDLDDPEFSEDIPDLSDATDEEEASDLESPLPESPAEDSATEGPGSSSAIVQQIGEDLEEADFYMKQGLAAEAEVIYQRVLSIAPNHPHALVRLGEVAAMRGQDPSAAQSDAGLTPDPDAVEKIEDVGDDIPDSEWNDDIAGPDDVELAPPTLEFAVNPEASADSLPDVATDDEEDPSLEDELAEQFLADVESSADALAVDESDADADLGDESAGAADLEFATSSEGLADETENADDAGSGEEADTLEGLDVDDETDMGPEPEALAVSADEPDCEADEEPPEIASPDDSFTDSSVDLGEAPELDVPVAVSASDDSQSVIDASFDLAAELSDVFDDESNGSTFSGLGSSSDGFEAVFNEFKKGVSQTLSEGDHDAHFDLGIAYREMGLLEDAKSEFQAAMLNAEREIECRHMLGLCCFEQEQYEEAVSQFEKISDAPTATEEQQLSAQFDLGRAWEALGERARARTAWEAVEAVDAQFCDVSSLLAALDEPPKPEVPADDLESFEDLLADATSDSDDDSGSDSDSDSGFDSGSDLDSSSASDSDPATDEYESFEGFLDDDDDAEEAPAEPEPDPEPFDEAEPTAALKPALEEEPEPEANSEPDPEPAPIAKAVEEPDPPRPRRRKKISFV